MSLEPARPRHPLRWFDWCPGVDSFKKISSENGSRQQPKAQAFELKRRLGMATWERSLPGYAARSTRGILSTSSYRMLLDLTARKYSRAFAPETSVISRIPIAKPLS